MGDMGEFYQDFNEQKRRDKLKNSLENAQELESAREDGLIEYFEKENGLCVFRENGKPKVNFWLSTGRWLVVGNPKRKKAHYNGGAEVFLEWYALEG